MNQSVGRVLVTSAEYTLQRLHSGFENDPWREKDEERPDDKEVESQAAR